MYFFMIRPQQKQRKQHQSMMSQLKKGDHVVTIGRLHGDIYEIDKQNNTVTLDCEGIYLKFDLGAIMRVVPAQQAAANTAKPEATSSTASSADSSAASSADNSAASSADDSAADQSAASEEK